MFAGIRAVAKNSAGLFLSRIELAAVELAEVRDQVLALSLAFALGILAVWFAVAYWTALAVWLTWESLGWKILFAFAAGFTLLAIGLLWYARSVVTRGKLSLPATMTELRCDRDSFL
ncbi:MAG: phage holin family protein [Pseudomonadota bacterium]